MCPQGRGRVDLVVENSGGKFLIEQHLTGDLRLNLCQFELNEF